MNLISLVCEGRAIAFQAFPGSEKFEAPCNAIMVTVGIEATAKFGVFSFSVPQAAGARSAPQEAKEALEAQALAVGESAAVARSRRLYDECFKSKMLSLDAAQNASIDDRKDMGMSFDPSVASPNSLTYGTRQDPWLRTPCSAH
jgi:hypothetical protein